MASLNGSNRYIRSGYQGWHDRMDPRLSYCDSASRDQLQVCSSGTFGPYSVLVIRSSHNLDPDLHVVHCASDILNIPYFQHPIDHQCLGRLCKDNWNRPFQESLRCRNRTRKISRGYPRTPPRTREGIQGLSGGKSESNQLPQPGGECHPGVLGHSRRGSQPGKSHMPSDNSLNVTSSGPLPTGKSIVRWD
jgi:hypothetical protein